MRKAQTSLIAASTLIEGNFVSQGDVEVLGRCKSGSVESKSRVIIREGAEVTAMVKAETLITEPGARVSGTAMVGKIPSDILKRYGKAWGLVK